MTQNYHIFETGELKREENTLAFRSSDGDLTHIPIETVETIIFHNSVDVNTKLLKFLNSHTISVFFFDWSGQFVGAYRPTQDPTSGELLVKQVDSTQHPARRREISQEIIQGSIHNMKRNLKYYSNETNSIQQLIEKMERISGEISETHSREELMGKEAEARKIYYRLFRVATPDEFEFTKRSYNPPQNEVNALISFGNSMLYSNVEAAICSTGLEPTISYVHTPGNRRPSLALDIADIFKPVIVDRIVLRLLNRDQIQKSDFRDDINNIQLTESGRKTFLKEYEDTLDETIEHQNLNRHVSYQTLLRLEAQKIKKTVLTNEQYSSFKRWW